MLPRFKLLVIAMLLMLSGHSQDQLNKLIDSLEQYAPHAKPGWDELDLAVGLFRQYLFSNQVESADQQLAKIFALKDQIPIAEGYGLIMENIRAYTHEGDDDKAIAKCLEAIAVAQPLGDKSVVAYARYQLAENYIFEKGDVDKALEVMSLSMQEIDESVAPKTLGNSHKALGSIYTQLGRYEEAHHHFQLALTVFKDLVANPPIDPKIGRQSAQNVGAEMHVTNTLNYIGDAYLKEGKTREALTAKTEGLLLVEKVKNLDMIAWMNLEIGNLYRDVGNLTEALTHMQKSRIAFEQLGLEKDIKRCNTNLISVLTLLKDYAEATKFLKENISYYQEKKDSLFLVGTYIQGIQLNLGVNNLAETKYFLQLAEPIAFAMNDQGNRALINRMKGHLAIKEEAPTKAVDHFKQAWLIFKSEENTPAMSRVELDIGNAFLQLASYDSAARYAEISLAHAEKQKDLDLIRDAYELQSKIAASKGDFERAYATHQLFFNVHDSLFSLDAQAKLKDEQVRQNVNQYRADKELAEQNAKLLASRNQLYTIIGIVLLIVLIMMAYLYVNLRKVKAKIQSQNTQLSQLNQTKDKFFGIIAHDLRSPLLGLQGVGDQVDYFLKKGQTDKLEALSTDIGDTTKKLTDLLDNLLNWALLQNGMIPYDPEKVNLKEVVSSTIALLKPVADLKQVKLESKIDEDSFVYADSKAVSTILRNIVSNALKYTDADGEVVVDVRNEGDKSFITINDTGTGISAEQLPRLFDLDKESVQGTQGEKGSGLGLVLCKELVELNKGTIDVVSNLGKGSSFILDLPRYPEAA